MIALLVMGKLIPGSGLPRIPAMSLLFIEREKEKTILCSGSEVWHRPEGISQTEFRLPSYSSVKSDEIHGNVNQGPGW